MKRIIKNQTPDYLRKWFEEEKKANRDVTYEGGFQSASVIEKGGKESLYKKVKESLLDEQGYLCCYTGKRIELETSHIEHLKPQSKSKENRRNGIEDYEDVKYQNLLAAFPKGLMETDKTTGQKKRTECEFGAEHRGNKDLSITPLDENCEQLFYFNEFGEVNPINKEADDTIKTLNLNCQRLRDERKNVIDAILLTDYLTEAAVKRASENAFDRDGERMFKPFCFVIQMACKMRLRKFEREKKIRRFARPKKNKK